MQIFCPCRELNPSWTAGVRLPAGTRAFSLLHRPSVRSIQPPIQWLPELFPRGKAAGALKLTPPSSAEVKKDGATVPLPYIL
jgi:hypothetical protein